MQRVRKAVIPAAGYGTRMLPITKTISKEMLPLVDKPIIQIVIEELVEAGIEDIIIVTAAHKTDMVDYFGETEPGLKAHLQASGPSKATLIEQLDAVRHMANFAFIEQHGRYGTGTPLLNAEPYLGGEPFVYTYADDFFSSHDNCVKQLISTYETHNAPVIGCMRRASDADYDRYGYVDGAEIEPGLLTMKNYAEKPGKANAPSELAIMGYYIITQDIVQQLKRINQELPPDEEFYHTYGINSIIAQGKTVLAKQLAADDYFDTGNKLEYMKTAVAMAARHPEIGVDFKQFMREYAHKVQ